MSDLARSVATAPRLTGARTVATGAERSGTTRGASDVYCWLLPSPARCGVTGHHPCASLPRPNLPPSSSLPPSFLHSPRVSNLISPPSFSLSLSLFPFFLAFSLPLFLLARRSPSTCVPSVQRSPDADDSHDGAAFPRQKTSTAARALLRGGRWRRQSILFPGFSRGSSPSPSVPLSPSSLARARFYALSSR